jgi:hypothetical protein
MKRLLCKLWGCWVHNDYPACGRCGSALYDADFVQIGRLNWVYRVRDALRGIYMSLATHHCEVCHRRIWFTRHSPCCSDKCYSQWVPF